MAAPESASRSSSAADSYIGSLISLTSKSEIRYEGILYNINTDESSIGLRNVRSFGTEGRKKDGPQIAPSDKVYEYILFRGSDIKDLQVKSSAPVQAAQPTQPINNDPAIIQSHYTRPAPTSTTLPSAVTGPFPDISSQAPQMGLHGSNFQGGPLPDISSQTPQMGLPASNFQGGPLPDIGSQTPQMGLPGSNFQGGPLPDISSQTPQMGLPGSNFQGGLPLYQPPGANLGPWGGSAPQSGANGGLLMPMYWPGYYGPGAGLQHMNQQSLFRPPTGMSLQQPMMPYPPLSVGASTASSPALTSASVAPLTLPPPPLFSLPSETLPSAAPIVSAPTPAISAPTLSAGLPSLSPLTTSTDTGKPDAIPAGQPLGYQMVSQTTSLGVGASNSVRPETSVPSLVTPGQLLQSGPALVALPVPSAPPAQAVHKDVEVVRVPATSSEVSVPVQAEAQPPILPTPTRASPKPNGTPFHNRHGGYRGRGRGPGSSRPVAKFTEDFDFIAMNEKFNKDEVWGHLGKISNPEDGEMSDEDDIQTEDVASPSKPDAKPVYNKDDFFDSLSSHGVGNGPQNGRTRYSEQIKIDTETFGEFSRYRGGRGGRGGRGRGGYYGRGYGYNGRGRGRSGALQSHTN